MILTRRSNLCSFVSQFVTLNSYVWWYPTENNFLALPGWDIKGYVMYWIMSSLMSSCCSLSKTLLETEKIIYLKPVECFLISSAKRISYASQKNTEQTLFNLLRVILLHIHYFHPSDNHLWTHESHIRICESLYLSSFS